METENKPPLHIYKFKDARVSRDGPNPHFLNKNNKKGPDKTCPCRSVIYTQNVNGLSEKNKKLESLLDTLVDIMIWKEFMTYFVQETWVIENTLIMVHGHMIFLHTMCEREEGTKRRNPGFVAIILALTTVVD